MIARNHHLPHLPWLAALSLLTGCALWNPVGPDYTPPETRAPDAWQSTLEQGLANGQAPLLTWWESFDDPVLNDLIAAARENNHTLKIAFERINEASAVRGISRSEWFPTVAGNGSVQTTRSSEYTTPLLPPGIDRETEVYQLGLGASWELDFWGRVRRSVESAQAGYEAGIEDYRDALVTLYAQVATAYIDARTAQSRIAYAAANRDRQSETLKLTKARFDAGLVPELDVHQAELNLARTEATIPSFRAAYARAVNRLGLLTGEGSPSVAPVLQEPAPIPPTPKVIMVDLPAEVLRQRPDVRAAERRLAAQTARIGVATADLLPRFSLLGSFSLESLDASDLFNNGAFAYGLGPTFRWDIFNAGRVRSFIRIEESRTEQALQSYEQTVLRAFEEMETSLVTLAQDRHRQDALLKAVAAAQRSVDLVLVLYRNGLTDFQNVLSMEEALAAAQDALATNQGDVARDAIRLYRSAGGGWHTEENPDR